MIVEVEETVKKEWEVLRKRNRLRIREPGGFVYWCDDWRQLPSNCPDAVKDAARELEAKYQRVVPEVMEIKCPDEGNVVFKTPDSFRGRRALITVEDLGPVEDQ